MIRSKSRFSGWSVLAGCFILMVFPGGLLGYTAGLFMYPICTEFGFSTTLFSLTNTFASAANAIASAFLVQYLSTSKKASTMKWLMLAALAGVSGGFALMGLCNQLWQFIMVSFLWNLGYSFLTYVPVGMIISNWFIEKRSLAMGIALAGSNVGGAVFNTVISGIISSQGWRQGYFYGGLFTFAASAVAIIFLLKRSPQEYNEQPLGAGHTERVENRDKEVWLGVDKKTALKSPAFVLLAMIMLLTGIYSAGVCNHVVNYLMVNSWEVTAAAAVMSVFTLTGIVGNAVGGVLVNKIGLKKGVLISGLLVILALSFLVFAGSAPTMAYLFAVLLGLATILCVLIPSLMVSAIFGSRAYTGIYGAINVFYMIGCAIAATVVAFLANSIGYQVTWGIMVVLVLAIILMYMACFAYGRKLKEQYPE